MYMFIVSGVYYTQLYLSVIFVFSCPSFTTVNIHKHLHNTTICCWYLKEIHP